MKHTNTPTSRAISVAANPESSLVRWFNARPALVALVLLALIVAARPVAADKDADIRDTI